MSENNQSANHQEDASDNERPVFGRVEIAASHAPPETNADAEQEAARLRDAAESAADTNARAAAFTVLGKFHARRGDIDAACEAFRLALHHNPHDADALAHLFFLGRTA